MRVWLLILFTIFVQVFISSCSTKNSKDYQLKTSVTPSNAGSVSPENGYFNGGDSLTITASPSEDWVFDHWEGDLTESENPARLEVNQDFDITAMFAERTYPLNVEIQGEGTVSEQIIQQKSNEYLEGTVVELTANPAEDWSFSKWSGDITGTAPQQELTITSNTEVTAVFTNDFVKTYGGSEEDRAYSSAYTVDGGLVITGASSSEDGNFDGFKKSENYIYVMKLSSNGEIEWMSTFTGSDRVETANSIIQTQDGGYAITGYTFSDTGDFSNTNRGRSDIFVIKLTSTGDTEWIQTFGGTNSDAARSILQTSNGDIVIVGQTTSNSGDFQNLNKGLMDGFVIRLHANGDLKWSKTYGGTDSDYIFSMSQAEDGSLVFTGITESENGDFPSDENIVIEDTFVMKTDADGNIMWVKKFGGSDKDTGLSIITSNDGGLVLSGTTFSSDGDFMSSNNGFQKPFVIKLDPSGNTEWLNVYDGDTSMIRGRSLVETQSGDFMIAAYSNSNTEIYSPQIQVDTRILVMKINASGTLQWMRTFEGSDDSTYTITKSDNNTFFITGDSNSTDGFFTGLNYGLNDIFVIQLDTSGELIPFE